MLSSLRSIIYFLLIFEIAHQLDIQFYDLQENLISQSKAQKLSSLIINISSDKNYKLQLQNNTLNLKNVKSNLCEYSAKLINEPSYGIFNICKLSWKIYTKDKMINIRDVVTEEYE